MEVQAAHPNPPINPPDPTDVSPFCHLRPNYLAVQIDNHPVHALIDTGATESCMSSAFCRRIRKVCTPPPLGQFLRMGDVSLVRPLALCTARVSVSHSTHVVSFLVLSQCISDVILGTDFLYSTRAVIDCGTGTITWDELPGAHLFPDDRHEFIRLCAQEDVVLHPNALSPIRLRASTACTDMTALASAAPSMTTRGLLLPTSLLHVTSCETLVWVLNTSSERQLVPQAMCVATVTPVTSDDLHFSRTNSFPGTQGSPVHQADAPSTGAPEWLHKTVAVGLSLCEKEHLLSILEEFHDIFDAGAPSSQLPVTHTVEHTIDTGDSAPIHSRPYRVSSTERNIIHTHVSDMLQRGVVKPSSSPWSSPVVLVKKKDGTWRFCIDFRKLNKITKKDVYPLPRIDDLLDCLNGSEYFSSLDLRSGYWQIPVAPSDREKTAFVTPDGLFEFTVMPFGLSNAPATFERMMDTILQGLKWQTCLCYLDDVVIFSSTFEDHVDRLVEVLSRFRCAGLQLNSKKCLFGSRRITVLGHVVDRHGIHPDPKKVQAVQKFPRPTSLKQLRAFLGLCSYFRHFIPHFADIAEPLYSLLKRDARYQWTDAEDRSFHTLKERLTTEPVLGFFVEDAWTELHTDASDTGLGAVLVQKVNGVERVIAYASRTLSRPERNYSTTEKECLAIVWAISKFRPYLYGRPFTVVTDHHSLCWLSNLKDPGGRLGRWVLKLQEYDITISYKSGRQHSDADALSRLHPDTHDDSVPSAPYTTSPLSTVALDVEQRGDPLLLPLIQLLEDPDRPAPRRLQRKAKLYTLHDGILYRKNYRPDGNRWLLVVPANLRGDIVRTCHDDLTAGHLGFLKTYSRLADRFFWQGMYRSVWKHVRACVSCQRRKHPAGLPPGHLQPLAPPPQPFGRLGIDFLGPFPLSTRGNRWILVAVDHLTRYVETKAVPVDTAEEVSGFFLHRIVLRHGAPRTLLSDRGTPFLSAVVRALLAACSTVHALTTSYHPQTNGLTERFNHTLADMMSMYVSCDHANWDMVLPYVTYAYNTARQRTTGYSPYYLLYSRQPTTLLDTLLPCPPGTAPPNAVADAIANAEEARQLARLRTFESQDEERSRYDARHRVVEYTVGDEVLLWTPTRLPGRSTKLLKRYVGPYRVTRQLSPVNYEVTPLVPPPDRRSRGTEVVHVLRMKPFVRPTDPVAQPPEEGGE